MFLLEGFWVELRSLKRDLTASTLRPSVVLMIKEPSCQQEEDVGSLRPDRVQTSGLESDWTPHQHSVTFTLSVAVVSSRPPAPNQCSRLKTAAALLHTNASFSFLFAFVFVWFFFLDFFLFLPNQSRKSRPEFFCHSGGRAAIGCFGGPLLEGMVKVKWRWSGCEQVLQQWSGLQFCSNQQCCAAGLEKVFLFCTSFLHEILFNPLKCKLVH